MNKVILVGRLTRDPELKSTQTGKSVANFTLAVDRRFKNAEGKKEADFIPCVVWGKQAESAAQYLAKGSMCSVCGRMQVRSYEASDGGRRYVTEGIVEELNFMSSGKAAASEDESTEGIRRANANKAKLESVDQTLADEGFMLMGEDDDIPF